MCSFQLCGVNDGCENDATEAVVACATEIMFVFCSVHVPYTSYDILLNATL